MPERLEVVDVFAGAGGLSEGFRQAGLAVRAGVELDPDAAATYAHNFPEAEAIVGDVRDPKVRRRLDRAAKGADLVIGGPPCQAFSQVRNHSRFIDDPRNALYREFVSVVKKIQPRAFVMENVPGLEQMGIRQQVAEDLTLSGAYRVAAQVLDAADFGVPQTRKRIVFIGVHKDVSREPPVLKGTGATSAFFLQRDRSNGGVRYEVREHPSLFCSLRQLSDPWDVRFTTAAQAIADLNWLQAGRREESADVTTLPAPNSTYQELMRAGSGRILANTSVPRINEDTRLRLVHLPPGGNHIDLSEDLKDRYLTGALWGPHNGTGKLGRRHYYAYRRLHPNLWSWTLNTKADSVYHYSSPRALSVREFARLQSFPDRFAFMTDPRPGDLPGRIDGGAAHSKYRQAGNAVPPLLARAIAEALLGVFQLDQPVRRAG